MSEAALQRRGGRILAPGDPEYPNLGNLKDPPARFSLRGSLCGAGAGGVPPAVAVIGSRHPDVAAVRMARRFGYALARAGMTVVSGGALGIDAAAHEGALEAGGSTVAVLGGGLLRPQPPRNRALFARMLEAGGGLCSELPADMPALHWHFPLRNRLIAALSRAVVVVRAAENSGCRYTVKAALGQRRPVFAVPAPGLGVRSAYGESLLAGLAPAAQPVRDPDELLEALGLARERVLPPGLERHELQVLSALCEQPETLGAIAVAAGIERGEAARVLAGLCARGLARPAGAGRFVAWDAAVEPPGEETSCRGA